MLKNICLALSLLITLISCASHSQKDQQVCPKVIIHAEEEIELTEDETRLVCGDQTTEAYKLIPAYQAGYSMTAFLQSRGYSNPRFETKGQVLHVYPREKTFIRKIVIDVPKDDEEKAQKEKLEKLLLKLYKKEEIKPKILDNIEAEALGIYRDEGFACAEVKSTADASTGIVSLKVKGLQPFKFGEVEREEVEGLYREAFDRFYSFEGVDNFSERELTLTEKRFLRSEVVQATYFQETCNLDENKFSLSQKFITGEPRTIRFGAGASTEVGPMARVKWASLRYGNMASRRELNLQASFKSQSLRFLSEHFFWKDAPRRSLNTEVAIIREDQKTYEELTAELKPHLQWTRDNWARFWQWSAGPSLISSRFKTNNNLGEQDFTTVALEGELISKTHSYEVYDIHPEEGELYQLNLDARHPAFGFKEPLLRMDWTIVKLMRLWSWGKGAGILGGRFNAGSTWVGSDVSLDRLPPSLKHYGGGSDDVRGFELNSIPGNNGAGALTKLSTKLEVRKTHTFIPTIESFAFIDAAYFGYLSWSLDERLFYSPGLGLRWLSPIGLVQTYVARALSNQSIKDDGFFYYIGLGGVF